MTADKPSIGGRYGFTVTRVFEAPREHVWKEWTEPARFADWFGGPHAEVPLSSVSMDVQPGGAWALTMLAGRGEIQWRGEYLEVDPPERLVFTVSDEPGVERYELVTVVLHDMGDGRTEMHFEQRGHMRPDDYERTKQGWGVFFAHLDTRLAGT
jgi:uncharacterized protein YndB with AHSA1/START domain